MEIIIDTNFVLTCAKEKIDFAAIAEEIIPEGVEWTVPQQVLDELGQLKDRPGMKIKDKEAANLSFTLLQAIAPKIVNLGRNPNVDIGIVNYALKSGGVVATMDRGLKGRLQNQILTVRGKNWLELI